MISKKSQKQGKNYKIIAYYLSIYHAILQDTIKIVSFKL